jgi:hypothetical protein
MRGITRTTALGAVVLATVGATALPAAAQNVVCDDDVLVGQTVVGTLVVPEETTCVLENVVVVGNITVGLESDLFASGLTVTGNITIDPDAYVDLEESSVQGNIDGDVPFGTTLVDSTLAGNLSSNLSLLTLVLDSDIAGNVNLLGGPRGYTDVFFDTARVQSDIYVDRPEIADVFNSTINGSMEIWRSRDGSIICTNEFDGDVAFAGGRGPLDIGAGVGCEVNYFGGNLSVLNHNGTPAIDNNIVRGDLNCTGNTGIVGTNNRVRGTATGQCEAVAGSMETMGAASVEAAQDRRSQALELRESRRSAGESMSSASVADAEEILEERREEVAELRGGDTPTTSSRDAAQDRARAGRG